MCFLRLNNNIGQSIYCKCIKNYIEWLTFHTLFPDISNVSCCDGKKRQKLVNNMITLFLRGFLTSHKKEVVTGHISIAWSVLRSSTSPPICAFLPPPWSIYGINIPQWTPLFFHLISRVRKLFVSLWLYETGFKLAELSDISCWFVQHTLLLFNIVKGVKAKQDIFRSGKIVLIILKL